MENIELGATKFQTETGIEELTKDGDVSKNNIELKQNFKYNATWKHHHYYARCSVKVKDKVTNITKRFSVFFPPKIIIPDNLRLENGKPLEIDVTIIANPYNEEQENKPLQDSVRNNLFSKLTF